MNTQDTYKLGQISGEGAAQANYPYRDKGLIDVDQWRDDSFEGEQNSRQFSPFEFTAHMINTQADAEELWAAYDEGVADGIDAYIKEHTK